jgi:hypothetical protein
MWCSPAGILGPYVSSSYYNCVPHTAAMWCSPAGILPLYMCPHTSICVSSLTYADVC